MGTCSSGTDQPTREINKRLAEEERIEERTNKLLFLGPGGSGKSTIFKQLQWLHGDGFSKDDCLLLKAHIYSQIITQMQTAVKHYLSDHIIQDSNSSKDQIQALNSTQDYNDEEKELTNAKNIVRNHLDVTELTAELADAIQYIWKTQTKLKKLFDDMIYEVLDETTQFFWDDLDRIKDPAYIPSETDIINVRYKTIGMTEKRFEINNTHFWIFDVGGQQSERKKWIHCFNEVTAVIFVISLACFNEVTYQNTNKNAMVDSLELFDKTINNKYFVDTHIILFLNKRDLFEKKITKTPITICTAFDDFETYDHKITIHANPNDYKLTTTYIRSKFEALNRSEKGKKIYTHFTCAMEKKNIEKVFDDVIQILIKQRLFVEGLN